MFDEIDFSISIIQWLPIWGAGGNIPFWGNLIFEGGKLEYRLHKVDKDDPCLGALTSI